MKNNKQFTNIGQLTIVFILMLLFVAQFSTNMLSVEAEDDGASQIICLADQPYGGFIVSGHIQELYCEYSDKVYDGNTIIGYENNKLGQPRSNPTPLSDCPLGLSDDVCTKYQEFDHGAIYYNHEEHTAFALFNDLDVKYRQNQETLGLPITSEIGNAQEHTCIAFFEHGYLQCHPYVDYIFDPTFWNDLSPDMLLDVIEEYPPGQYTAEQESASSTNEIISGMKMPFSSTVTASFAGGPHAWGHDTANSTYSRGQGAGLDFSMYNQNVLAMAAGTIIDIEERVDCKEATTGLGCWVAVRSDFSGMVLIYGHIQPNPELYEGLWVAQGKNLGSTTDGNVGNSEGPHVHVEIRTGFEYQPVEDHGFYNGLTDYEVSWGEVLDWNYLLIDDYRISGAYTDYTKNEGNDYDGTAINLQSNPHPSLTLKEIRFLDGGKVWDSIFVLMTTAAETTCETHWYGSWDGIMGYACEGEINDQGKPFGSYDNTIFSYGTVESTNEQLEKQLSPFGINSIPDNYQLFSTNEVDDRTRVINPSEPPDDPQPYNNCGDGTSAGAYFYANINYQAPCYFTPHDVDNFADTPLGDNEIQSVRMVGGYGLKLYRDTNQDGPYTVIPGDDANLNDNPYGGDYSSAEVVDQRGNCPTDGSAGVYLYSNRGFDGRCTFTVTDIPDLGADGIYVGNDDLSSIRFIGNWEATIYEDRDFGGRYDVIGSDDPDLDIRSLGGQYSSIEIVSVETGIQEVILISPLPPTPQRNGGFEDGLNFWSQSGGTFDIDTDAPNTGLSYVKGTSAEEAFLYQEIDIRQYSAEIVDGLIGAELKVWVHNGNSEEYKIKIVFYDANHQFISDNSSEWSQHDGGYQEKNRHQEVLPPDTIFIRAELHARRYGGDYTDVDFDDVTLKLLISEPSPQELHPCEIFEHDGVFLFDDPGCGETNPALSYDNETSLINLSSVNFDNRASSIHVSPGWSLMVYEQAGGGGARRCLNGQMWDLSVDQYDTVAVGMNNSISSLEIFPNSSCNDGLVVSQPLVVQQPLYSGQPTTARFAIRNLNNYAISLGVGGG